MSAYMVDREHIHFLVQSAMGLSTNGPLYWAWSFTGTSYQSARISPSDFEEATRVGQMLWDENAESIKARYPDTQDDFSNAPGPVGESFSYVHDYTPFMTMDPLAVLKACHCYEYQACEHDEWRESEAHAFIEALKHRAITCLPGYDQANWGDPGVAA